jgi:RNA polymerase I-specific transcription initiation factor RRN3
MELESEGEVDLEGGDGKWIRDLDVLQRAITSDLNPLLGCNTTVVNTFAKVAHHTNFAYCFSIIEANQQSTTRSTSSHSLSAQAQANGSTSSLRQPATRQNSTSATYSIPRKARQSNIDAGLDSYYPFDPFTLPRSKQYIDTLYRTWGEVSIPLDESESEDEDEEEEEDEDSDEEMIEHTHSLRTKPMSLPKGSSWNEARRRLGRDEGLSSSLEGMSISPGQASFMKR